MHERGRRFLMRVTPSISTAGAGLVLALALTGCGGGQKSASSGSPTKANPAGAKVFADAGCGNCHTLKEAGTTGTVGPNLDDLKPSQDRVVRQVRNGGVGMPSFRDKLSADQIRQVAQFVADATRKATGGGSVAAAFKFDDTTIEDCEKKPPENRCYEQAFANIAYDKGPKEALKIFDERIKTPGPIESDCHRIVHAIGGGSLAHYDGNVGVAFVNGSPSCTSGYYHGILERAFLGIPESQLGPASRRFCSGKEIRSTDFIAYQCVHGLGHGLMIYTGYDLPFALKVCHKLANGWDQTGCTGGVFMENYQSSYGVKSRWLRKKDLIYPCNSVAERDKYYCYDMVTARILPAVKYNWAKAARICRKSEKDWVAICFQSMGRDASGFTRLDPVRILNICKFAKEMEKECIFAAASDATYTDVSPRRGKILCDMAPKYTRGYCFEAIGGILGSLHNDSQSKINACKQTTRAYLRDCLRGAHA